MDGDSARVDDGGVLAIVDDVLEKGLRNLIRRVRTRGGEELYDQPRGTVIKPDAPAVPDADLRHRGIREGWGGVGRRAGESILDPSTRTGLKEARKTPPKYLERQPMTKNAGGDYFGEWDVDEYLAGVKEGAWDAWSPSYLAFWMDSGGKVHPVRRHDAMLDGDSPLRVPGESAKEWGPDAKGWMRVRITSRDFIEGGKKATPLTNPMLDMQFSKSPSKAQIAAIERLMEGLETDDALATYARITSHYKEVLREAGGDYAKTRAGPTLNREYRFKRSKALAHFLSNPKEIPAGGKDTRGPSKEEARTVRGVRELLADVVDPERAALDPGYRQRVRTAAKDDGEEEVEVKAQRHQAEEFAAVVRELLAVGGADREEAYR